MYGFKPTVSVADKLTVKPACELLWPYRVPLATMELPVRAFSIQRLSAG
jgi:hypothetical protein